MRGRGPSHQVGAPATPELLHAAIVMVRDGVVAATRDVKAAGAVSAGARSLSAVSMRS